MSLPPRAGGTLFGKTIETVLADRPCRVIIQSDAASSDGAARRPVAARQRV
jgi:APA family basic amino acid/polyamine antiporter